MELYLALVLFFNFFIRSFTIAILVSLTIMTRMVDEERVYIGSLKAMGYKNIAIASKCIIYATIASISDSIVGLAIGF